jgi:hypothetical protein
MPNYTLRRFVLLFALIGFAVTAYFLATEVIPFFVSRILEAGNQTPPYCVDLGRDSAEYLATGNQYKCNYK